MSADSLNTAEMLKCRKLFLVSLLHQRDTKLLGSGGEGTGEGRIDRGGYTLTSLPLNKNKIRKSIRMEKLEAPQSCVLLHSSYCLLSFPFQTSPPLYFFDF